MNIGFSSRPNLTVEQEMSLECERTIEAAVRDLVDQVITAGWSPEATFEAIKRIADRQATAYREDPDPANDPPEGRPRTGFSLTPF